MPALLLGNTHNLDQIPKHCCVPNKSQNHTTLPIELGKQICMFSLTQAGNDWIRH